MSTYSPIFEDAETPIAQLLDQVGTIGWRAKSNEVGVIQAAHAIDGEMWAPQLTPYNEWKPRGNGRVPDGHDGDLYKVGALNMGISVELREEVLKRSAEAARKAKASKLAEEQDDYLDRDIIDLPLVFGVKECEGGYVLAKVDLRQYAKRSRRERDLVLILPSHVDGVPIIRIDADAFSRFNVRGIGVRLVVVPDTVRTIDPGCFSYLAAEYVYIGAQATVLGGQPLERWALKPQVDQRYYYVSPENPAWQSVDGSLVSKDGTSLLFLAPPYGKRVRIPQGVVRVETDALAKWDSVPEVVECGHELTRMASKEWDGALWLCPQDAPMFDILLRRGVRLAGPGVVTDQDCWYDFDERGALLVAGPPAPPSVSQTFARAAASMADGTGDASPAALAKKVAKTRPPATSLRLPVEVEGTPLVRIASRGLITCPDTLIVPEGVVSVGEDNACKGLKNLSLAASLRRIEAHSFTSRCLKGVTSIPAGVASVGEGCFEYSVVRLEHTGTIVHVSANQLLNCFIERTDEEIAALQGSDPASYVPFDYAAYDELLVQGKNLPDRIGALVHRIANPFGLADDARASIVSQMLANSREVMEYVAREGDSETVAKLMDTGFINDGNFDEQIEMLRRCNRTDCVMLLMERHRAKNAGKQKSVKSRFAL